MIDSPINASQELDRPDYRSNDKEVINGHGIHDTVQLVLVGLLIIASVTVVYTTNGDRHQQDRYLRTYFNLNLLGKTDLGLYEQGLNIDECEMEFTDLKEIKDHFTGILNVSNSMQENGLVLFTASNDPIIKFEMQSRQDEFNITQFTTVEQAFAYFNDFQLNSLKGWLLSSYQFKFTINLGENKFVNNYSLVAEYKLHSLMMIKVKLDSSYQLKEERDRKLSGLRVTEQVLAALLFVIYLYQSTLLARSSSKHRLFKSGLRYSLIIKKKYIHWYIFLILMCLITMVSQTYAPICSFFQILPIFEFPEREKESEKYNFNKNLRFSFPLIMTILFQLLIFLNGFILYSMLMYPGEYFDNYLLGFFSYIYQFFQVGTYEIFTELQSYGNFAYMLYAMLYFYVFEVGNSLIPALFCTLIEMKITERFLKGYVAELAHESACPKCLEKNSHLIESNNVHIVINSPRLSPLINRKKSAHTPPKIQNEESQILMLYIEEQDHLSPKQQHLRFHKNPKFANYSKRILHTSRKLQVQASRFKDKEYLQTSLSKIQNKFEGFFII